MLSFGRLAIFPIFDLRDLWVGVFWRTNIETYLDDDVIEEWIEVFILPVPTLGIKFRWRVDRG